MSGIPSNIERDWAGTLAWVRVTYPWHRIFFLGFNAVLTALNIFTGPPWWGLWPLLITGLIFAMHYLVYKAGMIDDAWVDERAADLHYKSYDQGHIDWISERGELDQINNRLIEEGREQKRQQDREKQRDGGPRS